MASLQHDETVQRKYVIRTSILHEPGEKGSRHDQFLRYDSDLQLCILSRFLMILLHPSLVPELRMRGAESRTKQSYCDRATNHVYDCDHKLLL